MTNPLKVLEMSNQFFFIIVTLVEMTNQLIVIIVTLFEMTIPLKIATLLEMTNLLNVSPFTCYLKWQAQTLCFSCYLLLEVANLNVMSFMLPVP